MSTPHDRRTRKRLATRDVIADAATRMFFERGFDHVTVDEIAEAADVGRMTVFNHFPRKEDLFFDRMDEVRTILRDTLAGREAGVSVVDALRRLAHRLVASQSPYVGFSVENLNFISIIESSETLKARARAIRDEIAQFLAEILAGSAGQDPADPDAELVASLLVATWSSARLHAYRCFKRTEDARAANAAFLAIIDRGTTGLRAAMAGTPYAETAT
jgi:AcrR family transcriptional regulator